MPDTISPVSDIPAETVSGTRRPDACVTENVSAMGHDETVNAAC